MAEKTVVTLVDDLDGSVAKERVQFSFRGTSYEIDLSDTNAADFDSAMGKFIAGARKVGSTSGRTKGSTRRSTSSGLSAEELAQVRVWAANSQITVSPRGRIPKEILTQYQQATS
jgi:hypothetical protein